MSEIEKNTILSLDYQKIKKIALINQDVVPVIVQHHKSLEVLILAYINEAALVESFKSGYAVFWSSSRNCLWRKGDTSGDRLKLIDVRVNCEQNSLLFLVSPEGRGACHVKDDEGVPFSTCYYRKVLNPSDIELLD